MAYRDFQEHLAQLDSLGKFHTIEVKLRCGMRMVKIAYIAR
jgi:hypothetical protein